MDIENSFESEILEFKRELPENEKLAKEFIAMANTKGGKIIIGYDDKAQTILGVLPSQKIEEKIANIVCDYCEPRIEYEISYESHQNKTLLVISILSGSAKPYHLKRKAWHESSYVRIGSTTRLADEERLANLIREGKNISYDSETLSEKRKLDKNLLASFFESRSKRFDIQETKITTTLLQDLYLMRNEHPTIAGALLFLDEPQSVLELAYSYIKAARFKGTQKGFFLDQREIMGPLTQQIDDAIRFVQRNIEMIGTIEGSHRKDELSIPTEIIREMIVNAVIHRDYSIKGSPIHLAIYDDRVEITSPGGLPKDITPKNIQERQYNRNPILSKRLFEMGYFDSWGQGIDRIIQWSYDASVDSPIFIDETDQFTLIVFRNQSTPETRETRQENISELEEKVLKFFEKSRSVQNKGLQEKFNLSKTQAQTVLKKLENKGLIIRQGQGRSTSYIFANLPTSNPFP